MKPEASPNERFLSRWSRLKREQAVAPAAGAETGANAGPVAGNRAALAETGADSRSVAEGRAARANTGADTGSVAEA